MQDQLSKLLAERDNLERIIDNLLKGIIAHDKDRHIVYFNKAAEGITGYKGQEVLGKDCHEVFGATFCSGRCSCKDSAPASGKTRSIPLPLLAEMENPNVSKCG